MGSDIHDHEPMPDTTNGTGRDSLIRPGVVVLGGSEWGGSPMAVPLVVSGHVVSSVSLAKTGRWRVSRDATLWF